MSIQTDYQSLETPLVSSSTFSGRSNNSSSSAAVTTANDVTTGSQERVGSANKLGTYEGVIQPCLLNIFGAILFVRLPWAVGQTGWLGVVLQFALGGTLVVLTTLSIAAISTNGLVRGGGAYYMLSRSLGPEFGAAVGVTYYVAASISVAFYLIAFAENMVECVKAGASTLPFAFPGGDYGLQLAIASVTLLLLFAQSQIGAGFVAKANTFIFILLAISILLATVSFFTGGGHDEIYLNSFGYTGMKWETFMSNMWTSGDNRLCICRLYPNDGYNEGSCNMLQCTYNSTCASNLAPDQGGVWGPPLPINQYTSNKTWYLPKQYDCPANEDLATDIDKASVPTGFFQVFIVIFPAVTGIMAGTNFSGDLADPGKSIGFGTLVAIGVAMVIYIFLALVLGASLTKAVMSDQLTAKVVMQNVAYHSSIVVIGLIASTISSALGALVGSARVLQALARDELFPGLSRFAYGSPGADEPRVALVLSWAIAQACLFIGNLDTVSALISELFLVVYFSLNIACFSLRVSGAPNFRPAFKSFSWKTALSGAVLSVAVMFISSPKWATAALFIVALLSIVVYLYAPPKPWGDVSQAIIFHQVRKYLLRLDIRRQHPKFWRPSILLCVDTPHTASMLIDFCNSLKKGGLYLIGNVIVAKPSVRMAKLAEELQMLWIDYISVTNIKAFSEICLAESLRAGFYSMFMLSGIGGMKPNTVVFQFFPEAEEEDANEINRGNSTEETEEDDKQMLEEVYETNRALSNLKKVYSSSSPVRISNNTRPSKIAKGAKAMRKRNMRMVDEELVADKMDSVRSKMEYLMQSIPSSSASTGETKNEKLATTATEEDTSPLRRSSSMLVSSEVRGDNVGELVAIMGDALALKKNIVLARHFDQLDADILRKYHEEHLGQNMTVDVWVTASNTMNPNWDSMEGDLSLQVQLAYCLMASRNSSWNRYTDLRVVLVAVVREEDTLTTVSEAMDNARDRCRFLLNEIRIDASIHVVVGRVQNTSTNGPPPMLNTTTLNSLMKMETHDGVAMLFLQLPDCPVEGSTDDEIHLYVRNLKDLTSGLPPLALIKSARQGTMTTEL
jgi:potassium/chloride transporter 9